MTEYVVIVAPILVLAAIVAACSLLEPFMPGERDE